MCNYFQICEKQKTNTEKISLYQSDKRAKYFIMLFDECLLFQRELQNAIQQHFPLNIKTHKLFILLLPTLLEHALSAVRTLEST